MLRRDGERPLVERLGVDAVMYLKFVHHSIKYFALAFIIAIATAILNGFGANRLVDLSGVATSNIADGENLLWGDMVFAWLFSFLAFYFFFRMQVQYERLRKIYYQIKPAPYALMIRNVKPADASAPEQRLMPHFPNARLAVAVKDTPELDKAVEKRDEAIREFETTLAKEHNGKSAGCCAGLRHKDSAHRVDEVTKREEEVKTENAKAHPLGRFAFVEYSSEFAAHVSLHQSTYEVRPELAPAPEDIRWSALYHSKSRRLIMTIVISLAVYALVIFYLVPIAFVQGIVSLENLEASIPGLAPVLRGVPAARGVLQGVVPTIILKIFLAILPTMILPGLAKLMGVEARSWLDQQVLAWYFLFQILAVYIGSTIAGGFWAELQNMINDPSSIATLLGRTLPQAATFFLNYVTLQALSGFALILLRPGKLIISWWKKRGAVTKEETELAVGTGDPFGYGVQYALNLLVWIVGLSFAVVQPVIIPVCLIYFLGCYFAQRNNLLQVHVREYESGGEMWKKVIPRLIFSLFTAQLSLIIFLGLKKSYAAIPLTPLPLLSIAFWLYIRFARRDRHEFAVSKSQVQAGSFQAWINQGFQSVQPSRNTENPWEATGDDSSKAWAATLQDDVRMRPKRPDGRVVDAAGSRSGGEQQETITGTPTELYSRTRDQPSGSDSRGESADYSEQQEEDDEDEADEGEGEDGEDYAAGADYPYEAYSADDAAEDAGENTEGAEAGGTNALREISADDHVVREGEADRLARKCYLGYLAKAGTRITRVYEQPSLSAAQQRVTITANGVQVTGGPPRKRVNAQRNRPYSGSYSPSQSEYPEYYGPDAA